MPRTWSGTGQEDSSKTRFTPPRHLQHFCASRLTKADGWHHHLQGMQVAWRTCGSGRGKLRERPQQSHHESFSFGEALVMKMRQSKRRTLSQSLRPPTGFRKHPRSDYSRTSIRKCAQQRREPGRPTHYHHSYHSVLQQVCACLGFLGWLMFQAVCHDFPPSPSTPPSDDWTQFSQQRVLDPTGYQEIWMSPRQFAGLD